MHITGKGHAMPVRVRDGEKNVQLVRLVDGCPRLKTVKGPGKYILVTAADSSAPVNVCASMLLSERGKVARGDTVLCMITDTGNYLGFEKKTAQGMCEMLNMLGF